MPSLGIVEQRAGSWSSIAGLVAVIAAWAMDAGNIAQTAREGIYAVGFVLVFVGSSVLLVVYASKMGRKARYAEASPQLRNAIQKLADDLSRPDGPEDGSHKALSEAIDNFALAFTAITGTPCRVCVKRVKLGSESPGSETLLWVETMCRSGTRELQGEIPHLIHNNTAFNRLWQDKELGWFFGNDLSEMAKEGDYSNTSPAWKKNYRASVVWPIRKSFSEGSREPDIIGYLCVDARRRKAFAEEFDYPLGAMMADVLYPFLKKLHRPRPPVVHELQAPHYIEAEVRRPHAPSSGRGQ